MSRPTATPRPARSSSSYEFPCRWDADDRVWLHDEPITWDEVWDRWKARGPMNEEFVESIRRSRAMTEGLLAA